MKIVINTAHQIFGGAIQVALSFIYECRNFPQHRYYVWVGPGVKKSLREEDFADNFHFQYFDFGPINYQTTRRIQKILKPIEETISPDVIISTSGPSYFHSRAPQVIGFNLPLYIYPESPYMQDLRIKKRIKLALKRMLHFYFFKRDTTAYVVQTEDVNQRVRKAIKTKKVYTVTNTHNNYYLEKVKFSERLPPKADGEVRLLTLSAYYPHKNLDLIPLVAKELERREKAHVKFVLTLKETDFEKHFGKCEGIINVGALRPEECPSLYQECDMMFLPTLAECFSASYPEAMVMGKPIITTDLGFARSICGEVALYFKPKDPFAATDAIEKLLDNPQLQDNLIQIGKQQIKNFDNPQQRAKKYLNICQDIVNDNS